MSKFIAWIPARGGSKRLPRKNIMPFCGKPLIYYSIKCAQDCSRISDVFVSTDDKEIAQVSEQFGAKVIMRPDSLSSDDATAGSAARHVLESLSIQSNKDLTGLVTLQATQPLRSQKILEECLAKFENLKGDLDSLITVSLNRLKIGNIVNDTFKPTSYRPEQRSQDLIPTYFENGVVYVSKPELIHKESKIFNEHSVAIVLDDIYSRIDIDDQLDFDIAEFIFKNYGNVS